MMIEVDEREREREKRGSAVEHRQVKRKERFCTIEVAGRFRPIETIQIDDDDDDDKENV